MRLALATFLLPLAVSAAPDFKKELQPLLAKYCYDCHGEKKQEAGIELHHLETLDDAYRNHRMLERLAEEVRTGEMPPFEAKAEPSDAEAKRMYSLLKNITDAVSQGKVPKSPGRTTIRRLNRNEYNYTVRDLFGINFMPGKDFPADGAGGEGFDNTADALFVPPVLMERYLEAANEIADKVYASAALKSRYLLYKPEEGKRDAQQSAEAILKHHTTFAYRRRPDPKEDIEPLMGLFNQAQKSGRGFEKAMRLPLVAILVNPKFLFRVQHDELGKESWPLNDFELATRLSYFLWSSMPDRRLFQLADSGKLRNPGVLETEIKRMLRDDKAKAFSRHFAGQWLGFDDLIDRVEPDQKRYPQFTSNLRASMWRESVAFFDHLIRNNRPVSELIDSDYAFLNSTLARHYGIAGVTGSQIRKVDITNKQRGGVLGMGSVLTATSLPLRTSPVKRGKWILEAMLGDIPPPPPPDAGELPGDDKSTEGLTFRQQLEVHREKPKCAGCHARIDPLGFGLENFDAIGRWRTSDINGGKIDSEAVLPGDIKFSSPAELKQLLMAAKDKVARNVCRKMLAYSLGRSLEYYDEAVVNDLLAKLQKNDYQIQGLVLAIVRSDPFQNRASKR
ncbi:MAG: DUF1592 domain-containing protein [Akkermansiaceae bacterium]